MNPKLAAALLSLAMGVQAQIEPAVTGLILRSDGRLVLLEGVPGAWTAALEQDSTYKAAASSGRVYAFKSGSELTVADRLAGETVRFPAPDGGALFAFDRAGRLLGVHYPETGETTRFGADAGPAGWTPAPGERVIAIGAGRGGALMAVVEREGEFRLADTATGESTPLPGVTAPLLIAGEGEIVAAAESGAPGVRRMEWMGDGLVLLETEAGLLAWRPGGEVLQVPSASAAPLQVFPWGSDTPLPAARIRMPATAPGETSELRFRVRNTGAATLVVNRLFVDSAARTFELFNEFSVPRTFAPGGFGDFWLRFRPPSLGEHRVVLWIGDLQYEVSGEGVGRPALEMETGGTWRIVNPGATVDLGPVEREARLERWFRMAGAPRPPEVSGPGCAIDARGEHGEFRLAFTGARAGAHQCILASEDRQYFFRIAVTEFAPPRFTLAGGIERLESGRQERIAILFEGPARAAAAGVLRLDFAPGAAALPDDAAIAFLPSMSRSVSFTVREGAEEAEFAGEAGIVLQTGSTAGVLTLRASIGGRTETRVFRLDPAPVRVTSSRALAASGAAQVTIEGFDNLRDISVLAFTFWMKNGQTAAPGRMQLEVREPFARFFAEAPRGGGAFRLLVQFVVQGPAGELESIEVELHNGQGATNTGRVRFN
jgi:hypothetical protein